MKIAVSACLVGLNTKYDGKNNYNEAVIEFLKDKEYVTICPEVAGGLPTPRIPSEQIKDKVKEANLKPVVLENGITFEGYRRVYVCKKIYQQQFKQECFVDSKDIIDKYYVNEPYHNMYIGEIISVIEK